MTETEDRLLSGVKGIAEAFNMPAREIDWLIREHGLPITRKGRRIYGWYLKIKRWFAEQEPSDDERYPAHSRTLAVATFILENCKWAVGVGVVLDAHYAEQIRQKWPDLSDAEHNAAWQLVERATEGTTDADIAGRLH